MAVKSCFFYGEEDNPKCKSEDKGQDASHSEQHFAPNTFQTDPRSENKLIKFQQNNISILSSLSLMLAVHTTQLTMICIFGETTILF